MNNLTAKNNTTAQQNNIQKRPVPGQASDAKGYDGFYNQFSVKFEDRKYNVFDKGPDYADIYHRAADEDVYSVGDEVALMRAKESIRVLKSGYTRLHPLRVYLTLFLNPVVGLVTGILSMLKRFSVCIPAALISAFIYYANGEFAETARHMNGNAISVPLTFLVCPFVFRFVYRYWYAIVPTIPTVIGNAHRDRILATQKKWAELLKKRIKAGKKNPGNFVVMPDVDHYDNHFYGKDQWLVTGTSINSRRVRFVADSPEADLTSLEFLTDEDINGTARGNNVLNESYIFENNALVRELEKYRDKIAASEMVRALQSIEKDLMRQLHSGVDISKINLYGFNKDAADLVYEAIMEGKVDEFFEDVNKYAETLEELPNTETLFESVKDNKKLKKKISKAKDVFKNRLILADFDKLCRIIESRKQNGVPAGKADTGARIVESAELVNTLMTLERSIGHRGLLQYNKDNLKFKDRYEPHVGGSHYWDGKYHTVTDLQMAKTVEDMDVLRKVVLSRSEIVMSDKEFERYITKKFTSEFESAGRSNPALLKNLYRQYSRRYHPDNLSEDVAKRSQKLDIKGRLETAFRILNEVYEENGGRS